MGDVAEDVWIKELPRGPLTRLTGGGVRETRPRWTRDGRVTYVAVREGPGALYARPGDGTGSAELLLSHERQILEGILSADGSWLIARIGTSISVAGGAPGKDVIGLGPGRDAALTPLLVADFDEKNAAHELVEARIATTPTFAVQDREILFSIGPEFLIPSYGDYTLYDIAPDDERFVMLRLEEPETRELILVVNWLEELKARVPR
jgi:hypothetical protein